MHTQTRSFVAEGHPYFVQTAGYSDALALFVFRDARIAKFFSCQLRPLLAQSISADVVLPGISPVPLFGASYEDAEAMLYASLLGSLVNKAAPSLTCKLILGLGPLGHGMTMDEKRGELRAVLAVVEEVLGAR